jgi:hypothetical protein
LSSRNIPNQNSSSVNSSNNIKGNRESEDQLKRLNSTTNSFYSSNLNGKMNSHKKNSLIETGVNKSLLNQVMVTGKKCPDSEPCVLNPSRIVLASG